MFGISTNNCSMYSSIDIAVSLVYVTLTIYLIGNFNSSLPSKFRLESSIPANPCSFAWYPQGWHNLKMIGKGFVLFKINSSPTAFYTIKPICIIVIAFKVSSYFLKIVKMQSRRLV